MGNDGVYSSHKLDLAIVTIIETVLSLTILTP